MSAVLKEVVSSTLVVEYVSTEAALAILRDRYAGRTFDVSTGKGMDVAKAARAEVKGYRTSLEAKRKEIKAPVLERCRLIDEEAKRITAALVEIEDPIDSQIKAEEGRKAAEKAERERIELARVTAIHAEIAKIRAYPDAFANKPSADISMAMPHSLAEFDFAEFAETAQAALEDSKQRMKGMHAQAVLREQEAARLAAEREELNRLRAEQAERDRVEAAERNRIAAEERARIKAEQDALAADRAAFQRQQDEARIAAEPIKAVVAEIAQAIRAPDSQPIGRAVAPSVDARPDDLEMIHVLAEHYGVGDLEVIHWLSDLDLVAANHELAVN